MFYFSYRVCIKCAIKQSSKELILPVQKNQSIFVFYIKLCSTSTDAVRSRHNSEKETVVLEKYRKFERGELSRRDYVCILSYKFQPLI